MKNFLFSLIVIYFSGCHDVSDDWTNPLEPNEIALLQAAFDKVDAQEVKIYKEKIKSLSNRTSLISVWGGVRELKEYQEIYTWIKNEVKNFPALFYYVIYEEKITGEEQSNSISLLWDLSRELHLSIVEEMISKNDFNSINLIKQLLPLYSGN